ncbi:MAG TPA: hypothetical protein VIT24_06910 [Acidimicrobiales bacterium]
MDLSKFSTGDRLIAGSTIALFIFSFLPWFSVTVEGGGLGDYSADFSGWDVGFLWGRLPLLLAVLMTAYVGLRIFSPDTSLPTLPMAWGQALLGVGIFCAFLVILKLLIGEDGGGVDSLPGVDVSRSYGLFLSVLATIGLAIGGYFKFREGDDAGAAAGPPTSF